MGAPTARFGDALRVTTKRYELALLPSEAAHIEGDGYVVVDALRATTTIAVLFGRGLRDLVVADDIELARELAARDGRLLFGEVGGVPPEGFHGGNSPVEADELEVEGRGAVLFTTNGTRALCGLASGGEVVTGALTNLGAVADYLATRERGVVVCAGEAQGQRFAQEDFAVAGVILQAALRRAPGAELGDAAALAMSALKFEEWLGAGIQRAGHSGRLIGSAEHAKVLFGLGLGGDVQFASREDVAEVLPRVVECGEGWARLEDALRG